MKKTYLIIMLIFIGLTNTSAQTYVNGICFGRAHAPGILHFEDGTSKEFASIEIPATRDKQIITEDGSKKKQIYSQAEVKAIEVWNQQTPDKHYILVRYEYYGSKKIFYVWLLPVAASDYAILYEEGNTYRPEKDGSISVICASILTYHFVKRNTDERLKRYYYDEKALAEFFSDDPILRQRIENKEFTDKDYKYIVENYQPEM